MPIDVLKSLRAKGARSVAIVSLAGLAAGCSSGVQRFNDGFYQSAVPQAAGQGQASTRTASAGGQGTSRQGYPNNGGIDATRTGSVTRASGFGGASTAGGGSVQSRRLPPPSSSSGGGNASSYAAPQASGRQGTTTRDGSGPGASQAERSSGAAPSTLQGQAAAQSGGATRPADGASIEVRSGDTLSAIARRTGASVSDIKAANGLDGGMIRVGQSLTIPGASQDEVAALNTRDSDSGSGGTSESQSDSAAEPTATAPDVGAVETADASSNQGSGASSSDAADSRSEDASKSGRVGAQEAEPTRTASLETESARQAKAPSSSGISKLRWPVQGRVLKGFGEKVGSRRNDGLNISVPRGTPVKAAENGVVIYSGDGLKDFGNTVLVKHDSGLVTVYGHADSLAVSRGDEVKRGQVIAKSGMSGSASVPVLHFEVRKDSSPVDPSRFLG